MVKVVSSVFALWFVDDQRFEVVGWLVGVDDSLYIFALYFMSSGKVGSD